VRGWRTHVNARHAQFRAGLGEPTARRSEYATAGSSGVPSLTTPSSLDRPPDRRNRISRLPPEKGPFSP
jgi:hypothetical protein